MIQKEPHIIALDMDGTLLNSKKRISFKTLFYLRKLVKQGHKIILCSGRPVRSMMPYYKKLNLDTPMICYNGAYVFSPSDKNFEPKVFDYSKDVIAKLLNGLGNKAINVMVESNEQIWIDKEDKFLDKFFWYKGMKIVKGNLQDTLNQNVMTCIIRTPENYRDSSEISHILGKNKDIGALFWTGAPYFELCHLGVTKATGLEKIAKYYNIEKNNIISFGDSLNDMEMFDFSGFSILMKNGKDQIKNASKRSEFDNDHNGIYYELKKLF